MSVTLPSHFIIRRILTQWCGDACECSSDVVERRLAGSGGGLLSRAFDSTSTSSSWLAAGLQDL